MVSPSDSKTLRLSSVASSKAINRSRTKTIKETRSTCNACGKVWHYGKQEQLESARAARSNAGKSMMCCTGCAPAALIPDKKVTDLNKCPECGSKDIRKEQIAHEVAK